MDLNDLLNTPVSDLEIPTCPEGVYRARIISARLDEPRVSKAGNEYQMAVLVFQPVEAIDADPAAVEEFKAKGGFEDARLYHRRFVSRRREVLGLVRALQSLGVPTEGRTLPEVLGEAANGGYEARIEVRHEDYNGETRERVESFGAV